MKKEEIMALTIADLKLSPQNCKGLVETIVRAKDPTVSFEHGAKHREWCMKQGREFTVRYLIETYEELRLRLEPGVETGRGFVWVNEQLVNKLVKLGLTQLDWIVLPNTTVTFEMLKRLGKDKLGQRSILVLGTLSHKAVSSLVRMLQKSAPDILIHDLLDLSWKKWNDRCSADYGKSIADTRKKLRDLGFRYFDGVFMQDGTKRQLAASLMAQDRLSYKMACKMAEIAEKRQWVARFME